jgi:hypothetical protein
LDIGCGDCAFLGELRRRGFDPVGIELGTNVAALHAKFCVRERLDEIAHLSPFAAVTLWHSLEHFGDPRQVLLQARALMQADGVLAIAVPNADGWQARVYGPRWFHLDVPRHLHHFCVPALVRLIGDTGFVIERLYHVEFEYDLFGWIQSAIDCVVPESRVLFHKLTGKPSGNQWVATSFGLLAVMAPIGVAATVGGAWAGSGGTIIAIARSRV